MKNSLLSLCLLIVLGFALPSSAQEPEPCDTCAGYPAGAYMRSGGPELGGAIYHLSCQGGVWEELDGASCPLPPPANCDSVGQQCDDGSFYIGLSPEDGEKVYMTSAGYEASVRWDSASCSNCGNGTIATSQTDGRANTNALLAFNPIGFDAAAYCNGLNAIEAHGRNDWYLPAGGEDSGTEQNLFWLMVQAEGTVDGIGSSSTYYWSSSEDGSFGTWNQRFSDGRQNDDDKDRTLLVRCVRR